MWLKRNGVINLLLIPTLEKYGYCITYENIKYWILHTPDGVKLKLKRYTGLYNRIPYLDIRDTLEVFVMVR